MPSKKQLIKIIISIILVVIFALQINKRNTQLHLRKQKEQAILNANSNYAKLLSQRSIYRDSVYKIFIANFDGKKKIVFLKKGELTDRQLESKFFVHLYPKNQKDLMGKANHNPINFDSNFTSFDYDGQLYHVAHTELPDYEIEKLNLGQYSYKGNNDVNYKISHLIDGRKVAKILKENKESIENFKDIDKSF